MVKKSYSRESFGFGLQDRSPRMWDNADIPSQTTPIVEIMKDYRHDRYRIVRNGYAGLSGPEAIKALEIVMNRMLYVQEDRHFDDARNRIRDMISRAYSHRVNLKQLAEDKVWPIFWASMTIDEVWMFDLGYTRENAKEKIAEFRESLGLTKTDWAWMCNQEPYYLYRIFSMPPDLIRIRWPERLINVTIPELRCVSRFQDWLKAYFIGHDGAAIDHTEFGFICRDVLDAEQGGLDLNHAYRAKTWAEFCERVHAIEGRRPRYGRSPADMALRAMGVDPATGHDDAALLMYSGEMLRNFMPIPTGRLSMRPGRQATPEEQVWLDEASVMTSEHIRAARDMLMFGTGAMRVYGLDGAKPKSPEPFEWMTGFMEVGGYGQKMTCRLLKDTMMVWDEAAAMSHCLYRNYTGKMKAKDYIAYHINTPHLGPDHKGWTVGFRRAMRDIDMRPGAVNEVCMTATEVRARWMTMHDSTGRPVNKEVKDTAWIVDQVRGYKNSFNKDTEVDKFVTYIAEKLNTKGE